MAELRTLARPYAKAVFQSAEQADSLVSWEEQLNVLAALAQNETVAKIIASPSLTAEEQVERLTSLLGDAVNSATQNFIAILADNKRLPLLPQVAELFMEYKANKERSVDVSISSAFALDAAAEEKLVSVLKDKLQREVKVETSIDKSLLGGVLVRAGDVVIDGSVKGRLAKLAEAIN